MIRKYTALLLALTLLLATPCYSGATGLGDNPPNPVASITDVGLSATSHMAGTATVLQVTVSTLNVADNTAVVFRLTRNDLTPVEGVEVTATIQGNQAVGTLNLADTLVVGGYRMLVSISSLELSDSGSVYTILQPAQPTIAGVTVVPSTGTEGLSQDVTVEVNTASVDNGTAVRITLVDSTGSSVGGIEAQPVILSNTAQGMLAMPDTLEAGSYRIRVEVAGLIDDSEVYTVLGEGQQSTAPEARNVRITGIAQVGQVLSGHYDYFDADNDPEGVSVVKWYRTEGHTGPRSQIGTQLTYTLTSSDQGKYVWFEVEPVASQGVLRGAAVLSSPVGPIAGAPTGGGGGGGGGGFVPTLPPTTTPTQPTTPAPTPGTTPELEYELDEKGVAAVQIAEAETQTDEAGLVLEKAYQIGDDAGDIVRAAREQGASTVSFRLGDVAAADDRSQKVSVSIAPAVLAAAAEGAETAIAVSTPFATLSLPPALVQALAALGQPLEIKISRPAADTVADKLPAKTGAVADPLVIETPVAGLTDVTAAMSVPLPVDAGEREAFLNSLRMFTVHSDGEQRLLSGLTFDIDEGATPPVLRAVSFQVEKFSTFTLVTVPSDPLTTIVGRRGYSMGDLRVDMVACYYKDNNTFMPVRMLEAFGVEFDWDDDTSTATLSYLGKTIVLTIGSTDAYINNVRTPILGASDRLVAPELAPGRTMIPLRFVSENLGFGVHWDPDDTVTITLP